MPLLAAVFFGSMPYRNLLRGSISTGLVLVLRNRQLVILWSLVISAKAPWGVLPREKWLVDEEKVPLVVLKRTV